MNKHHLPIFFWIGSPCVALAGLDPGCPRTQRDPLAPTPCVLRLKGSASPRHRAQGGDSLPSVGMSEPQTSSEHPPREGLGFPHQSCPGSRAFCPLHLQTSEIQVLGPTDWRGGRKCPPLWEYGPVLPRSLGHIMNSGPGNSGGNAPSAVSPGEFVGLTQIQLPAPQAS